MCQKETYGSAAKLAHSITSSARATSADLPDLLLGQISHHSFGRRAGDPRMRDIWVEPRRVSPAVLVVVGQAPVGERNHAVQASGAARMPQGLDANVLMVAGVVGFVEAVAAAELRSDRVPQELHDLDPLLVTDPV